MIIFERIPTCGLLSKRIVSWYIRKSLGLKLKWERDLFPGREACYSGLKWLRRQYGKLEICGSSPGYDTNFSLNNYYVQLCSKRMGRRQIVSSRKTAVRMLDTWKPRSQDDTMKPYKCALFCNQIHYRMKRRVHSSCSNASDDWNNNKIDMY